MPFVKLDTGILDSTLWLSDAEVRVTFITMLAMAQPDGMVEATAPGISRRANLSIETVRHAIKLLESPDEDSRSLAEEGRRIVRIDGGYQIVNYEKYRQKDHTAAERMRRFRSKNKQGVTDVTRNVTEAEAYTEAEAEKDMSGKPDALPLNGKKKTALAKHRGEAQEVLQFLNDRAGRNFRPTDKNLGFIAARLAEGAEVKHCRAIIANRLRAWGSDPKMAEYLRPATLFNQTNFDQYMGLLGADLPEEKKQ